MVIKGNSKELFLAKTRVSILTLLGNEISINYEDIKRIDYCFGSGLKSGYMNFITNQGKKEEFSFSSSKNGEMRKGIEAINKKFPEIPTEEHLLGEKKRSIKVQCLFGYKEIGLTNPFVTITQEPDGRIFFDNNNITFYRLLDYQWGGSQYETLTTSETKGTSSSETVKKGKALKIGAGALLGSAVAGPAGVLVGAAMGAGSKSKSKTRGTSNSVASQITKNVEKDSTATLTFLNLDNQKTYTISIKCNSDLNSKIICFDFYKPQNLNDISRNIGDTLSSIKNLKELLDMGAITPEEFELKKKQILSL